VRDRCAEETDADELDGFVFGVRPGLTAVQRQASAMASEPRGHKKGTNGCELARVGENH
jgi:hypothetical protein